MPDANQQIKDLLTAGCTEKEFQAMRCPKCGASLLLHVHPTRRMFFVRCEKDNTHLAMHGKVEKAPNWWDDHVSGGWT